MRSLPVLGIVGLFLGSSPAFAGGVGLVTTGGIHATRAYYYKLSGEQGIDQQIRPNGGIGLEGILGDRDERIQGLMRLYVLSDAPVTDPDIGDLSADQVVYPAASEQGATTKGLMSVGVQFGVYGDPDGFQIVVDGLLGSCFITDDSLQFLQVDVGPGVTWNATQALQLYGTVAATGRYRKGLSMGGNAYVGVRYLFD